MAIAHGSGHQSVQPFQRPALVPVEMALGMEDDSAPPAPACMHAQHGLLRHGAARQVDRRGQPEDAGDLRLELGHHPALAVAVDGRSGRDRGEQVSGALDAVPGQGPVTCIAQSTEIVVHGASVRAGRQG